MFRDIKMSLLARWECSREGANGPCGLGAKGWSHWRNMGLHGRKPCLPRRNSWSLSPFAPFAPPQDNFQSLVLVGPLFKALWFARDGLTTTIFERILQHPISQFWRTPGCRIACPKKLLTNVSKRVPGVHGKRGLERGWQKRLAKGWRRVSGFPCTLPISEFPRHPFRDTGL